ncbi:histamine H2 receptor-like [Stylophora pistillata]|nr:histamine H2 receptor-like [Stylophora pistillata]
MISPSALKEDNSSATNLSLVNNSTVYGGLVCEGRFTWFIHGPMIPFCVLIIASNIVVIALVFWKESLRTLTNIILVSLAVSDLMSGLVGIPLLFACPFSKIIYPCIASVLFMRFTTVSTVLHFVLVASDRYAMIIYSMRYNALVTRSRVVCALTTVWITSIVVSTVQMTWYDVSKRLEEKKREDEVYTFLFIIVFFALPLLYMLCVYSHILVVSLRLLFATRARRTNLGDEPVNSIMRDFRGTVILISMLVVFTGCWFPFYLLILQDHVKVEIIPIHSWEMCLFTFMRFLPPMSNPVFCSFCKRDFRRTIRNWLSAHGVKMCRKKSEHIRVRFTRGQSDGFTAGCVRSGTSLETSLQRSPSPRSLRAAKQTTTTNH